MASRWYHPRHDQSVEILKRQRFAGTEVFVVRQPDGTLTHVPCKTIFAQEAAQGAHAQWRSIAEARRERAPKFAELKDEAREDVLAYTSFPKEHWPQIASTNPLERLNGEVKRRSNVSDVEEAQTPFSRSRLLCSPNGQSRA